MYDIDKILNEVLEKEFENQLNGRNAMDVLVEIEEDIKFNVWNTGFMADDYDYRWQYQHCRASIVNRGRFEVFAMAIEIMKIMRDEGVDSFDAFNIWRYEDRVAEEVVFEGSGFNIIVRPC